MNECCLCKGKLINTKEEVTSNGKTAALDVLECQKRGETFSTLKESERVRRELNPSWLSTLISKIHQIVN